MMLISAGSSIEEVIDFLISLGYDHFVDITNNEKMLLIDSSNFMNDLREKKFGSFFNPEVGFFCEIVAMRDDKFLEIVT